MATTSPRLLRWFASKNPWMVLVKLLPLVAIFIYGAMQVSHFSWLIPVYFLIGVLTWSFFEYATHRWAYHIDFKNRKVRWFLEAFHIYHHTNMRDYRVLNAGILLIYPLAIIFWLGAYLISGEVATASYFGLGTLAYCYFYENVHYYIHYRLYHKGYIAMIQKYHLYHHYKKWDVNYGNTISLWDRVLGTYDERYRELRLSAEQMKDFILSKEVKTKSPD